jgi:hypothetical protein
MSILDGFLAAEFYSAFADIYTDAILIRVTRSDDGTGSLSETETAQAIKVQRDDLTEAQRVAAGYGDRDVRILVLRQGVGEMDNNCKIMLYGLPLDDLGIPHSNDVYFDTDIGYDPIGNTTYRVSQCRSDPAGAYWELRTVRA